MFNMDYETLTMMASIRPTYLPHMIELLFKAVFFIKAVARL